MALHKRAETGEMTLQGCPPRQTSPPPSCKISPRHTSEVIQADRLARTQRGPVSLPGLGGTRRALCPSLKCLIESSPPAS